MTTELPAETADETARNAAQVTTVAEQMKALGMSEEDEKEFQRLYETASEYARDVNGQKIPLTALDASVAEYVPPISNWTACGRTGPLPTEPARFNKAKGEPSTAELNALRSIGRWPLRQPRSVAQIRQAKAAPAPVPAPAPVVCACPHCGKLATDPIEAKPAPKMIRRAARTVVARVVASVATCDVCHSKGPEGSECEPCGTERLTVLPFDVAQLRERVKQSGIPVRTLAQRTGYACNTLHAILRGATRSTAPEIQQAIASAIGGSN